MHNTNTMPGLVRGGHHKNSPEGYQRVQSGCYLQMKKSRSLQKLSPSKTNHYEYGRQTYCMKRTKSYYEAMGLKVEDKKREMFPGKGELFPGRREKLSRSKSEGLICAENSREKCNAKEGKVKNSGYFVFIFVVFFVSSILYSCFYCAVFCFSFLLPLHVYPPPPIFHIRMMDSSFKTVYSIVAKYFVFNERGLP